MALRLTSEDQLCVLLARGPLTPDEQARARQILASPLRWPLLLERAYSHQVYPLVYRNLRALGFPGVPDAVRTKLKGAFLANALRNKLLTEELVRLLRLLGKAGVSVIPLKGITLAQTLYGDVACRVCADIDILIPPKSVIQIVDLLLTSGYRDALTDRFFSNLVLRYGRHYTFVREEKVFSYLLELHWKLVQNSSKNNETIMDLWAEARSTTIFGVRAYTVTPEWQFLYLAMHATDHGWQTLKWLADIHEICSSHSIDWEIVRKKAKQFELDSVVRQTLSACSLIMGTPMPTSYLSTALTSGAPLFPATPYPPGAPEAAFFHLRLLKRPLDKLRFVATVLLVPKLTDRESLRLPPSMSFLYYAVRPLRLTWKWSWAFLSTSFGRLRRIEGFSRTTDKTFV